MSRRLQQLFSALVVLGCSASSAANPIFYEVENLGGIRWEYTYTVENLTPEPIEWFTVWFPLANYSDLQITGNPSSDWDGLAIQPGPNLPDDGFADWVTGLFTDYAPIEKGEVLGGFSVAFDWLGTDMPGSQFFEIIDPQSFNPILALSSGDTQPLAVTPPPAGVPEPPGMILMVTGLLIVLSAASRRRLLSRSLVGGLLLLPTLGFFYAADVAADVDALSVESRTLVDTRRVSRTDFAYTYTITLNNAGEPLSGVVATVTSASANTVIVEGTVDLGDVASGAVTSTDTFTMRQNRRFLFNPEDLTWSFTADEPAPIGDNAPAITSTAPITGSAGAIYRYQVEAEDADAGDELSFTLQTAPSGMSIDADTGEIEWTPSETAAVDVDLRVTDSTGLSDRQIYLLRIDSGSNDQPPTLAPIADQVLVTGSAFDVQAQGNDPEGATLSYRVLEGPDGLAIGPGNGLLRYTASAADVGTQQARIAVVDPGGQRAERSFSITVVPDGDNNPPTIEPVADQQVPIGGTMQVALSASDADDGDILSFALAGLPAGAQFDAQQALFSWTPSSGAPSAVDLVATVTDSAGASDSTTFTVTVVEEQAPPEAVDDAYRVGIRDLLDVPAPGLLANDSDPNGDSLTALLAEVPGLGTIDAFNSDGRFVYSPPPLPEISIGLQQKCSAEAHIYAGTMSAADVDADGEIELAGFGGGLFGLTTALAIIDGSDCSLERQPLAAGIGQAAGDSLVTLVNLDNDPELEVVGPYFRYNSAVSSGVAGADSGGRLMAVNLDGSRLENWPSSGLSEPVTFSTSLHSGHLQAGPVAADLDGDGSPELIHGWTNVSGGPVQNSTRSAVVAYDGRTGSVLWEYIGPALWSEQRAATPTLVDLDLDGDTEIIWHTSVLDHEGNLLFTLPTVDTRTGQMTVGGLSTYLTVAVANFDDDPYPEIIGYDARKFMLYSHTGAIQKQSSYRGGGFAFPYADLAVAELDGDPQPEFLTMLNADGGGDLTLRAFEFVNDDDDDPDNDLVPLWDQASDCDLDPQDGEMCFVPLAYNQSRSSSPVAFDFDRDGIDEIIHLKARSRRQPPGLYIIDGEAGSIIAMQEMPVTNDYDEALTVADVDGDGSAEIVTNANLRLGADPVQIWDNLPGEPFPPAPPIRIQTNMQPTLVNADGSLPTSIEPHWLIPGMNKVNAAVVVPDPKTDETDTFTYFASDGLLDSAEATVRITLAAANAPLIVSTPPAAASPGFELQYGALATDADAGDSLSFTLLDAPDGMTINALGLLSWTPSAGQSGTHSVEVLVTDSQGNADRQRFEIEVLPPTTVPLLAGLDDDAAQAALDAAGLAPGNVSEAFSLTVPIGEVVAQGRPAGDAVAAGTAIDYSLSLGPQPIFVPTLTDLPLSAAQDQLTTLTLSVGAVTFANHEDVPRGSVISQSIPAGNEVTPGSPVDLVISGGPALELVLAAELIGSGQAVGFSVQAFDIDGSEKALPSDLSISVLPDADATGTPPTVANDQLQTTNDTRGLYRLQVESPSLALSVEEEVLVDPAFADDALMAAYGELSAQLSSMGALLDDLSEALRVNDAAAIATSGAQLRALRDAVDLAELQLTPAMDLHDGFLPETLPGVPNSADDAFADHLRLLLAAVRESAEFLALLDQAAGRNDDTRAAFLNDRLAANAASAIAADFSSRGLVAQASTLHQLFSVELPRLLVADLDVLVRELEDQGLLVDASAPGAFYERITATGRSDDPGAFEAYPAFFSLAGVTTASGIRTKIIKDLYVKIVVKIAKNSQNLIATGLIRQFSDSVTIPGIVTGASQSFHGFGLGHSIVEAFSDGAFPDGHVVQLVGPTLVADIASALNGVRGVSFKSRKAMKKSVKKVKSAAEGAVAALKAQFKQLTPDQLLPGCVFTTLPGCQQLGFGNGLPVVHKDGAFPAPVLILVHDVVGGNISVGSFLFFPNDN